MKGRRNGAERDPVATNVISRGSVNALVFAPADGVEVTAKGKLTT